MMLYRQQTDESNHEMVNLLTQQIGTMFNPLIQSTNQSYQALATQMGRIEDFFASPQTVHQRIHQIQNIPHVTPQFPILKISLNKSYIRVIITKECHISSFK